MVKLIALKDHPPFGKRIKTGETYEVDDANSALMQRLGWAAPAPEGSPDPVFIYGALKRRDVPASPARVDMQAEPARPPRVVGAMGYGSGFSSVPAVNSAPTPLDETPLDETPPPRRGRGRPRKSRTEEPGDEGEAE